MWLGVIMVCSLIRSVCEAEQETRDRVRLEGGLFFFSHGGTGVEEVAEGVPIITRLSHEVGVQ